jgi:hypothetical protein
MRKQALHFGSIGVATFVWLVVPAQKAVSQILPNSPTTQWTAILYGPGNPTIPDPSTDQQTGSKEADIVGNTNHPSLYANFYDGGTPSLTDGQLAFRLRLAEEKNPPGFSGAAFIGMDGNADGALDIFVGVDNSGSADFIGIWRAGSGANTSPATTSINNPSLYSFTETASNYGWLLVSATSDPLALSYDVDSGGGTDRFLSFVVPFTNVVAAMNVMGIGGFNEDSTVSYVAATATQANSLNQDLNGVNGGINSSATWASLGGFTLPYTPSGNLASPVPEPRSTALAFFGGIFLLCVRFFRTSH